MTLRHACQYLRQTTLPSDGGERAHCSVSKRTHPPKASVNVAKTRAEPRVQTVPEHFPAGRRWGALVDQSFLQVRAGRLTRVMVSGGVPGLGLRLWLGLPLSSRVGLVGFLT